MANITPNIMAQTNMELLTTNFKSFSPIATSLFAYDGAATPETDQEINTSRTLLQNMIDLLPSLMQAINNTPTSGSKA